MLIGHSISYAHNNGAIVFSKLNFSLQKKKYALVGENGIGKSTLALILAKNLEPSSGSLQIEARVYYLAQFESTPDTSVAEYLLDLWQASSERQLLAQKLLGSIPLERSLPQLSGGEWMRVRLAKALGEVWDFLILDEPTNNLDREARAQIQGFVMQAPFPLLVISHDRLLLREVDEILELSSKGLQVYGGNFDFYRNEVSKEKERQAAQLNQARHENKKRQQERTEKMQAQEKRTRLANEKSADMGLPKIIIGGLKRQAQKTAAKLKIQEDNLVEKSLENFQHTFEDQKKEKLLYFELPETSVPDGKIIFELSDFNFKFAKAGYCLWPKNLNFILKGPARLALAGRNGSGKSTLLKILLGQMDGASGIFTGQLRMAEVPVAFIDQNYFTLDPERSVLENVYAQSRYDLIETRNYLARFLFMGDQVHQRVRDLSGGEKLKAALAKALLQNPAPQVLILDEPTNNLDLAGLGFLEKALLTFKGALLVVSHDADFLAAIGCDQELHLG